MANIFSDVVQGFGWLGKKIAGAPSEVNRVVAVTQDVKADAKTLLPELVTVIEDVETLTTAIVKDGGAAFTALRSLSEVVLAAYAAKGLDFSEDALVLTEFKAFGTAVMAHGTWLDVISAEEKTAADFDKLGASATVALKKLEADV